MVVDYNPRLPNGPKIIKKHANLLYVFPALEGVFSPKSIIQASTRGKNLKEIIAPSNLKPQTDLLQPSLKGSFKCRKKCHLCQHLLLESNVVKSFVTGKCCKITQAISCTTNNVIHAVSCEKCKPQHVGSTSTQLKVRFRNHKTAINTNKKTCEMAAHFNATLQNINDIKYIRVEQVNCEIDEDLEGKLLAREAYRIAQLLTVKPYAINKNNELKSKKRVNYYHL